MGVAGRGVWLVMAGRDRWEWLVEGCAWWQRGVATDDGWLRGVATGDGLMRGVADGSGWLRVWLLVTAGQGCD